MKIGNWILVIALAAAAAAGGWWAGARTAPGGAASSGEASAGDGPCPGGADAAYWKAPMDPTYVRDGPGKSPMDMDLVPVCVGEGAVVGGSEVRIDPGLVQNMGVRTAPVERRDLSRNLRTVGRVVYDERRVDHVHTKVQGWIERLYVEYEGEAVRRGQPLLELYSPELVSTQEELLLAARYRDTTRNSRFEDVSRGGEDLFRATRRRLELWDVPKRDIERLLETGEVRKNLTLYAPTEGVVTHMMVRKGMEVGPNSNLYTIADLSRVWVYADVYEYELPWVRTGQNAIVDLSYLPGRSFEGAVTYVYPFLDPKTRTARVRVELENPDLTLKPDMFANVTIETEPLEDVIVIPEEAVIRSGRRSLAVVALGEGRFSPREVMLGINSGDGWIEVIEGLAEGDRIVTSGQFLIDSESKLQEAAQKMLAAEPDEEEMPEEHAMPMPDEGDPMPETDGEMDSHDGQGGN
ncbi:MAG: efflux RND transporter periplasmic adaptor subunit [Deltaproteobacteria bacterium]|nr:efflux RND transporter periplasmic adaptor subunit [Deltaproteobacteria bacterium]